MPNTSLLSGTPGRSTRRYSTPRPRCCAGCTKIIHWMRPVRACCSGNVLSTTSGMSSIRRTRWYVSFVRRCFVFRERVVRRACSKRSPPWDRVDEYPGIVLFAVQRLNLRVCSLTSPINVAKRKTIHVKGIAVIGAVSVSGLPQRADHELVVEALCLELHRDYASFALPKVEGQPAATDQ